MLRLLITIYLLAQNCLSYAQEDTSKLKINQNAPTLKVEKWLKGKPIANFEKGQVYIIELGFIACGPCRVAIPHLTELAKKYKGKASVISIFVYENNKDVPGKQYINKVEKFINGYGDKIGYTVAIDDEEQTIARTWFEPASRVQMLGFPAIFVVDQNQKIVWIGSATQLDDVVTKVINRKFNPAVEDEKKRIYDKINQKIYQARMSKDFGAALYLSDFLIEEEPNTKFLFLTRFEILLESDMKAAVSYGRKLLNNECHDEEPVLTKIADKISSMDYIKEYRENRELNNLVVDLCERALELSMEDVNSSTILKIQARAFFMNGLYDTAIEKQKLAINTYDKAIQSDPDQSKRHRDVMLQTLDRYRLREKAYDFKY